MFFLILNLKYTLQSNHLYLHSDVGHILVGRPFPAVAGNQTYKNLKKIALSLKSPHKWWLAHISVKHSYSRLTSELWKRLLLRLWSMAGSHPGLPSQFSCSLILGPLQTYRSLGALLQKCAVHPERVKLVAAEASEAGQAAILDYFLKSTVTCSLRLPTSHCPVNPW